MSERRKPDDRFDAALAKGLRREDMAIDECPDAETFAAYWDRALTDEEQTGWDAHFARCSRCQAQLAALARTTSIGEETAAGSQPTSRGLGRWLDIRWLAPAASLAAVLLAVWVIQPDMIHEPQSRLAPDAGRRFESRRTAPPAAIETAPVQGNQAMVREEQAATSDAAKASVERLEKEEPASRDQLSRQEQAAAAPLEEAINEVEETSREVDGTIGVDEVDDATPHAPSFQQRVGLADAFEEPGERVDALPPSNAPLPAAPRRALDREASATEAGRGAAAFADGRLRSDADLGRDVTVAAPNSSVRWRSTGEAAIEHSSDGGVTWTVQRPGSDGERWLDGAAASASSCWFVGVGGAVVRTDDGETWRQVASPTSEDLTAIDTTNEHTASVTTASGRRFQTTDGGASWQER